MQRPKRKEDEEDLIRFQNQFMQQGIEPSAKVQRVARDATISKSSDKARDIVSLHDNGMLYKRLFITKKIPALTILKGSFVFSYTVTKCCLFVGNQFH